MNAVLEKRRAKIILEREDDDEEHATFFSSCRSLLKKWRLQMRLRVRAPCNGLI